MSNDRKKPVKPDNMRVSVQASYCQQWIVDIIAQAMADRGCLITERTKDGFSAQYSFWG